MATVINTPAHSDSGSGFGFLLGVVLLLFVTFLFFVYGLPMLRGVGNTGSTGGSQGVGGGAPAVEIPKEIDVNINQPGTPQ